MTRINPLARASATALAFALLAPALPAQDHQHPAPIAGLGTVHFATSCRPEVATEFDRAIALLHSFEFGPATRGFEAVLAADSSCAMAAWGVALARWTNPMAVNIRPPALLARGREASDRARRLAATDPRTTPREKGYVEAVAKLYDDYETRDQRTRVASYVQAMADLAAREPADVEAKVFHALALAASADPTDKTYANLRQAGAMLEALWAKQPEHPGLAHYIIHAYDVPALAPQAAAAARRYADIAPAAPHALHMPSHTFTRLGMWEQSVATNRRSADVARRERSPGEVLHASDYMVYAYLQMRRDSAAKAVIDAIQPIAERFDPNAVTGAAPGAAGVFAIAAMPARYALERRAWAEAARLEPKASAFPWADAMTWFARALGAANSGRLADAKAAADTLGALQARLGAKGEGYWAEQVAIQQLGARAHVALAEGQRDEALARMREAATREDATEKSAVTPGPLAPARELLGDMLLGMKRPGEALAEYRRTLEREPNRYRALLGAQQAARASGDRAAADGYARDLAKLTGRRVTASR